MPQVVAVLLVAIGLQLLPDIGRAHPVYGPDVVRDRIHHHRGNNYKTRDNDLLPPSLAWLIPEPPHYLELPTDEDEETSEHIFKREARIPVLPWHRFQPTGDCPRTAESQEEFFCPTPDASGNWHCINDFKLCDGVKHCPHAEDEQTTQCLYYRVIQSHLNILADQIIVYTDWLRNINGVTRIPMRQSSTPRYGK